MRDYRTVSKELSALDDVLLRIGKITMFLKEVDESEFALNEILQEAIIRQISVIGEACKKVSDVTREKYSSFPWRLFAGMRDRVVHQYDHVDLEIIWTTAKEELPGFVEPITKIRNGLRKELIMASLWSELSNIDQNRLLSDRNFTCVSVFRGKNYLVQISSENKFYCLPCEAIKKQLEKQPLFSASRLIT